MKQQIQALIKQADFAEAIAQMLEYAETQQQEEMQDALILLSARLTIVNRKEKAGTASAEELRLEKNRIADALLEQSKDLPDAPLPSNPEKPKGISERQLKQQLFFLMLGIKLIVLCYAAFHYSTGGLGAKEFSAIFSLLLPILASYSSLMFQDFLDQRHFENQKDKSPRIKRNVQVTVYFLFVMYLFAFLVSLHLKASGQLSFSGITTAFAVIETLFGVYIHRIVATFFPKK
ncbi:MAG: hypothetical protein ACKVTZ_00915 [Bacteroidia bacterium]